MKYSIANYTNALMGALKDTPDSEKGQVLKNFIKIIARNGDLSKREKIIEAVHRKAVNINGGKWVIVELAREVSEPKMRLIKEIFTEKDFVDFRVNPALVAGIRITVNGEEELDNSLNKKLQKLF